MVKINNAVKIIKKPTPETGIGFMFYCFLLLKQSAVIKGRDQLIAANLRA